MGVCSIIDRAKQHILLASKRPNLPLAHSVSAERAVNQVSPFDVLKYFQMGSWRRPLNIPSTKTNDLDRAVPDLLWSWNKQNRIRILLCSIDRCYDSHERSTSTCSHSNQTRLRWRTEISKYSSEGNEPMRVWSEESALHVALFSFGSQMAFESWWITRDQSDHQSIIVRRSTF